MCTIVSFRFALYDAARTMSCSLDLLIQIYVSETQNGIDYVHIDFAHKGQISKKVYFFKIN